MLFEAIKSVQFYAVLFLTANVIRGHQECTILNAVLFLTANVIRGHQECTILNAVLFLTANVIRGHQECRLYLDYEPRQF